ncbi:MAG: hypothetical protein U9P36_11285 [Thermodesulfobacteriota bacterium]|nr:hypothetical protein [Thermodesulfobacteriota bacterium]
MQQEYKSKSYSHVFKIILVLIAVVGGGVAVRAMVMPKTFGDFGHYRGSAIEDEMNRPIRNGTNASCLVCHPYIRQMHLEGVHNTVSCEFCHGPMADHVKDGKVIADLPKKQGEEIKNLCLRCHNQIIRARPKESIKMISMPQHLEEKHVRIDHNCNQCHNVHAPLMWVNQAKAIVGAGEDSK